MNLPYYLRNNKIKRLLAMMHDNSNYKQHDYGFNEYVNH